jgi:hypothetical protein
MTCDRPQVTSNYALDARWTARAKAVVGTQARAELIARQLDYCRSLNERVKRQVGRSQQYSRVANGLTEQATTRVVRRDAGKRLNRRTDRAFAAHEIRSHRSIMDGRSPMKMGLGNQALKRDGENQQCDKERAHEENAGPVGSGKAVTGLVIRIPQRGPHD